LKHPIDFISPLHPRPPLSLSFFSFLSTLSVKERECVDGKEKAVVERRGGWKEGDEHGGKIFGRR
jgi:hypothetical protein